MKDSLTNPPKLIGKRKLFGAIVLFIGSLILCFLNKTTGDATLNFWVFLFGIYTSGNVGAKILEYYQVKNNNVNTGDINNNVNTGDINNV